MRVWPSLLVLLTVAALAQQPPPAAVTPPVYQRIPSDVEPQLRGGRTFVPVRVISEQFGATVAWDPATQRVTISREGQPSLVLTIGARQATIGDRTVTLDAAPYLYAGRTMVPLRVIAEAYGARVDYRAATQTVFLIREGNTYVLPLASTRAGIVIDYPRAGELVRTGFIVQGLANVFEGALIIEVRDTRGQVLGRTIATAGMGAWYPYRTPVYYNLPTEDAIDGRVVVWAEDPSGRRRVLHQATVNVRLASTI